MIQWGLLCLQRDGGETVPGCSGTALDDWDYCYAPPVGTLVLMGDEDEPIENFPLGTCQGDCDSDADCEVSFKYEA